MSVLFKQTNKKKDERAACVLICEYTTEKSLLHPEFAAQELTCIIALKTRNIATFTGTFFQGLSEMSLHNQSP